MLYADRPLRIGAVVPFGLDTPTGRLEIWVRVVNLLYMSPHNTGTYGVNVTVDAELSSDQVRLVDDLITVTRL
jgi:hypothetical protein